MTPVGTNDLTGAIRYRSGFRGVLILQVEERVFSHYKEHRPLPPGKELTPVFKFAWRDARVQDLRVLECIEHQIREAERFGAGLSAVEESIAAGARTAKGLFRP